MTERQNDCTLDNSSNNADRATKASWNDMEERPEIMDQNQEEARRLKSCCDPSDVAPNRRLDLDALLKYHKMRKGGERRPMEKHIIICPFCDIGHSVPVDFDAIHRCSCGACYKVCGNNTLENGVSDIADELWTEDELDFIRSVPIDFCNIVIEKDFDRLLDLKQNLDPNGIERFCKYDMNINLSLVWVKRLF